MPRHAVGGRGTVLDLRPRRLHRRRAARRPLAARRAALARPRGLGGDALGAAAAPCDGRAGLPARGGRQPAGDGRGRGRAGGGGGRRACGGVAVAGAAGARLGGVDATWLGAVQLVPTVVLLVAFAAAVDVALSGFSPCSGSGAAVALALFGELRREPPRSLAPALLLFGAGHAAAPPRRSATTAAAARRACGSPATQGRWRPRSTSRSASSTRDADVSATAPAASRPA